MIRVTTYISGAQIANDMLGEMEEAAQFFPQFAKGLASDDLEELEDFLRQDIFSLKDKISLKILGELLVRIGESK